MTTLLHLDSSPMGPVSVSRELSRHFSQRWLAKHPGGSVIRRDLSALSIPPVTQAWISSVYTPEDQRSAEQRQLLALSDSLIDDLYRADEYLIAMPLHNFNIPAVLKLWIDQLYRVGKTFDYVDGKPHGLLLGKRASILISSGGVFADGSRLAHLNHAKPYLRTILGIFGVTDVRFLEAGGTKPLRTGEVDREAFMQPHLQAIQAHLAA